MHFIIMMLPDIYYSPAQGQGPAAPNLIFLQSRLYLVISSNTVYWASLLFNASWVLGGMGGTLRSQACFLLPHNRAVSVCKVDYKLLGYFYI